MQRGAGGMREKAAEASIRSIARKTLGVASARLFQGEAFHQVCLDSLDLQKPLPLMPEEVVHFFMQLAYLQLCFEVYQVIMLGAQSILILLAVLAHHNDGRLHGSETRKDQVKQNIGVWVKGFPYEHGGIHDNPDEEHDSKDADEAPASAKCSEPIGQPFPACQLLLKFAVDVLG